MLNIVKKIIFRLLTLSIRASARQHNNIGMMKKLEEIVPDLSDQYTNSVIHGDYLNTQVRSLHAMQTRLMLEAVKRIRQDNEKITVVDIGDSSGNHLQYFSALSNNIRPISVNIDPEAVEKIKAKGFEAYLCRAELLHEHPSFTDDIEIFTSFEMLEHLFDPISFLRNMAVQSKCKKFVVSVPSVNKSRVGLRFIRRNIKEPIPRAENTHIFELCPDDWDLLFKFSGWKVTKRINYTQYPRLHPLSWTKYLWRNLDFEGFYGVILEKDDTYSSMYQDW